LISDLSDGLIVILATIYLVAAKVRERLEVSKRVVKKMTMRVNLKKLNAGEVKEQNQVTIRNKSGKLRG
jgi:hypothetical protein